MKRNGEEEEDQEECQDEEMNKGGKSEVRKTLGLLICGTLVYYHCAYRNSSLLSLLSDVLIVLLCSLAILGLLFRQMNISVPVDPLEWQISQDTANSIVVWFANTVGAAESVLRVAATGHDKRLFFKVVLCLYVLSALGRLVSGVTVAYAGLCLFCLYMFAENSQSISACVSWFLRRRNSAAAEVDNM
ncbi:reticulon-like protein B22 [Mangifera indica]|uniref:reticulon-like protein B22 n=1 Tax=Mangifera indica TaxID=29780 RepID=UPI001CFAC71A|nr:reticulon-like protein B22 [Mangifera indica]